MTTTVAVPLRLTATLALTVLAALAGLVSLSAPAHAESGFRYWGYYHLQDGSWALAQKGAQNITPEDGAVEGFRYATTVGTDPRPPRATPTFAEICAGTEASGGEKRIGIVLDYGTPQDASDGDEPPQHEAACAVVPADATTQQALESVEPLRIEGGLICAIGGYPSSGCAEEVPNATVPKNEQQVELAMPSDSSGSSGSSEASSPADEGSGSGVAVAAVAVAVVLLGGGAFAVARKRAA